MTRLNQLSCKTGALFFILLIGLSVVSTGLHAQTLVPISVTGWKQDVIADTGTNPKLVTSCIIDGANISDHVLYSKTYANTNSTVIFAGGIVDNGTVVSGGRTYQFQPFDKKNAVYMTRGGASAVDSSVSVDTFMLTTPARYSWLSFMTFSTEGVSALNVDVVFTDGTKERSVTNFQVLDWYNTASTTTPIVYVGTGRLNRNTNTADGGGSLPRFYGMDFMIGCANQEKLVQSIIISDTTIASNSPRALIFAISGQPYTAYNLSSTVLPARCGSANNGTIQLNVTGGSKPFTYSWNTIPAQTTPTASGLSTGTYTCTITDSNNCVHTFTGVVPYVTPTPVTAHVDKPSICSNETATLYVDTTAAGYTPSTYTWSPGSLTGSAVTVSPGDTTLYTVNAEDIYGCTSTANVTLDVKTAPIASFTVTPDSVCLGAPQQIAYTGTGSTSAVYNWNSFAGATVQSGSGQGPYSIVFNNAGTYTLKLTVTENGCTSTPATHVTTVHGPLATPVVTQTAVTSSSITFSWQPVPGATGYIVSVNGGVYVTPTSGSLGLTHNIVNLQPLETITISVIALGVESCRNSLEGKATGITLADEIFIPNSFSPNNDGRNESFRAYGTIIASANMKIFNQWGELIFESSDWQTGWDGKYKGKLQPMGVYIYAMKIRLNNGQEIIRKGMVNLLH